MAAGGRGRSAHRAGRLARCPRAWPRATAGVAPRATGVRRRGREIAIPRRVVDTPSHMATETPSEVGLHTHPGRPPHTHDDPLDASHAHAHADVWLSDVSAGYGDRTALEHVTVAVEPGSLLAVVGP